MEGISGLLSLYEGDDIELLSIVLDGLQNQSRPLDELVVVLDGPVTAGHRELLQRYESRLAIRQLPLLNNVGLGAALAAGLKACRFQYVARVDSDDISVPDRMALQAAFLDENSDVAAVGGWITEFEVSPDNIVTTRRLPTTPIELRHFSRRRSPLNHTTAMMRRGAALAVGNYAPYRRAQDYHLWVRLLVAGYELANVPKVLVNVNAGARLGERRGGIGRLRTDIELQREFLRLGFLSKSDYITNILARSMLRLAPNTLRRAVYQLGWR